MNTTCINLNDITDSIFKIEKTDKSKLLNILVVDVIQIQTQ